MSSPFSLNLKLKKKSFRRNSKLFFLQRLWLMDENINNINSSFDSSKVHCLKESWWTDSRWKSRAKKKEIEEALCVIFMILVSHESVKKCVLGGCTITSKTLINVVWNLFFTPLPSSGPLRSKKFQTTLILAFEANSALTRENETKIVKGKKNGFKIFF